MSSDSIIQQDILKALAYFDIFRYPLTVQEITGFLQSHAAESNVQQQLLLLQRMRYVFCIDGLYMLHEDAAMTERRLKGNQLAVREMKKAVAIARWLFCFPFVRSIAVSGSLSKNYADAQTDIDFFIITAGGRLWLARTLLHILYKLPGFKGTKNSFCLNYYIDDVAMEIEEKNIFTATEIITLLPLEGVTVFNQFKQANKWVDGYYPQYSNVAVTTQSRDSRLKKVVEALFNNRFGNWLEQHLMKLTSSRWHKKMLRNAVNQKGGKISMKAGPHYAKPDPENFQRNIIGLYEQRLKGLADGDYWAAGKFSVVKEG